MRRVVLTPDPHAPGGLAITLEVPPRGLLADPPDVDGAPGAPVAREATVQLAC
jgi:hypothetical protein